MSSSLPITPLNMSAVAAQKNKIPIGNLPLATGVPALPRCVIFDFDLTITLQHTGGHQHPVQLDSDGIRSNVANVDTFIDTCYALHQAGVYLGIATFGDASFALPGEIAGPALIETYMEELFGDVAHRPFFTPDAVQAYYPMDDAETEGKNTHIRKLLAAMSDGRIGSRPIPPLAPSDVLLVDDDADNVRLAIGAGYQGAWVMMPGDWMANFSRLAARAPKVLSPRSPRGIRGTGASGGSSSTSTTQGGSSSTTTRSPSSALGRSASRSGGKDGAAGLASSSGSSKSRGASGSRR